MDRTAFVFLITLALPSIFDSLVLGQDGSSVAESGDVPSVQINSDSPGPSIGGIPESVGSTTSDSVGIATVPPSAASIPVNDVPTSSDAASVVVNPKKKMSMTEELLSNPLNYLLLLIVCVYVYLLFLRPNAARKESMDLNNRLKNLKKNDRVVTTAGIHGIVSNINSEAGTITLRVDENTNAKITVDRASIRTVVT
jgi:preprotein translocase YajC subunit